MRDETKAIIGVCKALDGLIDVMESLPDTTANVDLWKAIGNASQIAKQVIKDRR